MILLLWLLLGLESTELDLDHESPPAPELHIESLVCELLPVAAALPPASALLPVAAALLPVAAALLPDADALLPVAAALPPAPPVHWLKMLELPVPPFDTLAK